MKKEQLIILGQTNYRNQRKKFGIKKEDRRRHMYIVGKTGMGKSTLLLNMIVQDIWYGNGVAVLDPHGDLAERLLDYIPPSRINETIYFNPADTDFPIAFNPLYYTDPKQKHLVASGLVQVFKKIWADSWGPRLEYVLRNAILALLERPGHTLLAVTRMLVDDVFRARIVKGIKDPVVRNFWTVEFEGYPKVFRTETISPIQNKVGQFLSNPLIRNIVGQTKTKFDLSKVMDQSGILIMNLSKGRIGEDNSSLLGSLMVTQLYLAALRRAKQPELDRKDFYLYIDELQSFVTEDFPSILSEARKYRLNIAGMANQFISQLPESLASSILGNVGTLIAFASGSEDAEILAREFHPLFNEDDIQNLSKHQIYLKQSINGSTSIPFSAEALPAHESTELSSKEKIIVQARERYCGKRTQTEDAIGRWISLHV
ncbi:MAG TPA: type IV secretion system DNA-binding domain-containing protein [candidate division Zixibacteria bacterium]|nr:type IV secretion system DNA-binding domain-containing protein [candidate division Zixibacteria bacterium]